MKPSAVWSFNLNSIPHIGKWKCCREQKAWITTNRDVDPYHIM